MIDLALQEHREAVVREHMDSENRHEYDATMATFGHPRYEIVPTGEVFDGEEVRRYFQESRIVCERVYFDSATILRQLGVFGDPS